MSGRDSFHPYPDACFATADSRRVPPAPHGPWQNRLLAALPAGDYQRLRPHLEPVSLPLGWTLQGADDRARHLYFLTAGILARMYVTENGDSARLAVTGNEGAVGVASFLSGKPFPGEAVMLSPGYAYRLRPDVLKYEFVHNDSLRQVLMRYTLALIVQTMQIAACNRHHSLEQQLCRWLLLSVDRVACNELTMTQELIANMLGVRREGVTESARRLQDLGLIHYSRGRIAVLDRPGLEARACECYAVVKREYDRLLPLENATDHVGVHPVNFDPGRGISGTRNPWQSAVSAAPEPVRARRSTTRAREHFVSDDVHATLA